jgi:hypothetical protein
MRNTTAVMVPLCPRMPLDRERSALPRVERITGAAVLKVPFDL